MSWARKTHLDLEVAWIFARYWGVEPGGLKIPPRCDQFTPHSPHFVPICFPIRPERLLLVH